MRIAPAGQMPPTTELGLERGTARESGAAGAAAIGAEIANGVSTQPNATGASVFERAMQDAVGEAAARSQTAAAKVDALAAGTADDLHGTLISTKEAEISLRLVNSVRNKLVDAFHELWRTNV